MKLDDGLRSLAISMLFGSFKDPNKLLDPDVYPEEELEKDLSEIDWQIQEIRKDEEFLLDRAVKLKNQKLALQFLRRLRDEQKRKSDYLSDEEYQRALGGIKRWWSMLGQYEIN